MVDRYGITVVFHMVQIMVKKPPSRIKYEQTHPVITARVNQEIYARLQEARRDGQSYADILRIGLEKQEAYNEPLMKKIEELELEAMEREDLAERRTIRYSCYICNRTMIVESEQEKEVCRQALRGRFRHSTCYRRG